jgi:hypothetical protein
MAACAALVTGCGGGPLDEPTGAEADAIGVPIVKKTPCPLVQYEMRRTTRACSDFIANPYRGHWSMESLFPDAPPEIADHYCLYTWSGGLKSLSCPDPAIELLHYDSSVDTMHKRKTVCTTSPCSASTTSEEVPYADPMPPGSHPRFGGSCDACGYASWSAVWVSLPGVNPSPYFNFWVTTTDGPRELQVDNPFASAFVAELPTLPPDQQYIDGTVHMEWPGVIP